MALAYVPKRRYKGMGLLGLGNAVPTRIWGVQQRAAEAVPAYCPKCQSESLVADRTETRRVYCYACGEDVFLVRPAGGS